MSNKPIAKLNRREIINRIRAVNEDVAADSSKIQEITREHIEYLY